MSVDETQQDESLRRYLADQVRTATPVQRLLMLFDQLRRDLRAAELAFEGGTLKEVSDSLVHAQHVIMALRDPLDTDTELGRALSGIYGFCIRHLVTANLTKDPKLLPDVVTIVDRLAEANRTAAAAMQAPAGVA